MTSRYQAAPVHLRHRPAANPELLTIVTVTPRRAKALLNAHPDRYSPLSTRKLRSTTP